MVPKVLKLLIVEDDQTLREILADHFEDLGFQVVVAHNGRVGLDCLRRDAAISHLITDNHMPQLTGVELIQHVADEGLRLSRILLCTGGLDWEIAGRPKRLCQMIASVEAALPGVFSIVEKPCAVETVSDILLGEQNRREIRSFLDELKKQTSAE